MRRLLPVALLFALACSSSTGPRGEPHVAFTAVDAVSPDAPDWATSPPSVRVSAGRIDVAGLIGTGNPCYDLRAETDRASHRVSLTVIARQRDVACIQVIARFAYLATIDGLDAGSYELVVAHAWEDSRGTRRETQQVLARTVTVP